MPPPEKKPRPKPKPKPPKPRPKLKTGPAEAKPMAARPAPESKRDGVPASVGGVPIPFSCETYHLCPPPPGPPATVHLRSGRLPTPLIAVSAALLAVSALLLLALLVRWLVRQRRQQQAAPPLHDEDDEESVLGVDTTAWGELQEEEEAAAEVDSGDVHHVWFIRTKGLDERAIAAIAAVVYDAKSKQRAGDDGCAVCLAEFRDGETLRLLPRCGHAFHRGCIDTWLRAHVNCPLCRAPVQVASAAAKGSNTAAAAAAATRARGEEAAAEAGGERAEEGAERGGVVVAHERAVRRAASMITMPRRAWLDMAPASSSGREEDMATGLAKIRRMLKFSEWDVAGGVGAGRSASFGAQRWATRSGPSTAVNGDDIESSR